MTVLEHIKHLVVGLTSQEKLDLAGYLSEPKPTAQKPESLRGDWIRAFAEDEDLDADFKSIRGDWEKEWRSGDFVG